jgi:hypothetical protein
MDNYLTSEMISMAITVVVIPILGIIAKYIVMLLKSKVTELEHNIHNDTLNKYLNLAEDAIETAVISVNQTFVDAMKKQGTFDHNAMEKSFHIAKNKALAVMGASAVSALKDVYKDMDVWLDNKIEFYVKQSKK